MVYRAAVRVLGLVLLVLWLPAPAVAQDIDLGYMGEDGWVFETPETAGVGPDASYSEAGGYADVVYEAAAYYGISGDWLYNTMMCESGGDPNALGAHGEVGIMQIKPWLHPGVDPWDPVDSIWYAASMFAAGESGAWVCS